MGRPRNTERAPPRDAQPARRPGLWLGGADRVRDDPASRRRRDIHPCPPSTEQTQEVPVTPPEDLMREHGVLKRILLIYREGIRRINAGEPVPARPLHAGGRHHPHLHRGVPRAT
ncbi:hypothetical protein ACFSTC_20065 [Nonomuraea ferruginea]